MTPKPSHKRSSPAAYANASPPGTMSRTANDAGPNDRGTMSDNQVVQQAAVEAAGQALRDAFDWGVTDFDKQAQRALEAAAPHMPSPDAASVWDEAATVLYMGNSIGPQLLQAMYQNNPYRPTK